MAEIIKFSSAETEAPPDEEEVFSFRVYKDKDGALRTHYDGAKYDHKSEAVRFDTEEVSWILANIGVMKRHFESVFEGLLGDEE